MQSDTSYKATSPIIFIVFNRPLFTEKVFQRIASARPYKLLIIADGPRPDHPTDVERCSAVRDILNNVHWPCDVLTNFSATNLGCRVRIQTGLDWAFDQVEEAIIIEDDILPDPSFFRFCDEMLERYRDDGRVCAISGCTCVEGDRRFSYRFSHIPFIWGWATWRRAWEASDKDFGVWPEWNAEDHNPDIRFREYWDHEFSGVLENKLDSWDYQFVLSSFRRRWLTATSNTNLTTNLGIGSNATNTTANDYVIPLPVTPITFPLRHPPVQQDVRSDRLYFNKCLRPQMFPTIWERAVGKSRIILSRMTK